MIRLATPGDIPWMMEWGKDRFEGYDANDTANYFLSLMAHDDCILIRGDNSVGAAYVCQWPYNKKIIVGEEVFITGKGGFETVKILRHLKDWAKSKGASRFHFGMGSESMTKQSLEPLARRLKAVRTGDKYVIHLGE